MEDHVRANIQLADSRGPYTAASEHALKEAAACGDPT